MKRGTVGAGGHLNPHPQRRPSIGARGIRAARYLAVLLLVCLGPPDVQAQSVPTNCRPGGGTNRDCATRFPTPYTFFAGTCASGAENSKPTEAQAFTFYRTQFDGLQCTPSFVPQGWISPGAPKTSGTDFVVACGGMPTAFPQMYYTRESSDWLLEQVTKYSPAPACSTPNQADYGAVRRTRSFVCPAGYDAHTQDVCSRNSTERDYDKMLGSSCPPKGECSTNRPINIGAGNKLKAETDYRGSGTSPLTFTRYYNSLPYSPSWSSHYHNPAFVAVAGLAGYAATSAEPSEVSGKFATIGLAATGVGWRHTYQRAIVRETSSILTSAFAFRPDGRVLTFTKMTGQWYAQADVSERLEELVDGGGVQTGWRFTLADSTVETYDLAGRLLKIRARSSVEETLSYDACNRAISVTDSFGATLTIAYTNNCASYDTQRVASITVPGGGTYQYGYDTSGRLTSVTYPDTKTVAYHYENATFPAALTGVTDESGNRYATYGYDSEGRANLSELAGGVERVSVAYPANGSVAVPSATVTTPLGASIAYTFVVKQGITKAGTQSAYCEGCPVNAKALTYDTNGNITISKDFKNVETRYVYDTTRNLETSRTEAYGTAKARTITTAWHSTFRLPTQIDEPNRRTTFTHDTNGNVLTRTVTDLSVTPNVSRTWTYTYNSLGQVLTEDGPRTDVTDVTTYAYYGSAVTCSAAVTGASTTGCRGQAETITNALSHVTTYDEYNAHGQALKTTDANGVATTLAYDARQRLTSREAGGETTTFEYWPTGLLKKITMPDSSFLEYTYDAAHRLTEIEDSEGNRIVYTLDAAGNRTKEETFDPSSYLVRLQHRAFNTLNQLWKEIGSANTTAVTTTFGYDDNGNQTSIAAPLSRNTANLYDELNRLKQITDPTSGVTQFGYDANDNLTSVTDPRSKVTSYVYNGFGDLKQLTSPDTGVTNNVYDTGGNLSTSTDARGKTGTRSYDALNRSTQLSYPDQTITYTYDTGTNNKGRLMQVTDGSGSTSWTYTSLGRVASRTQVMSGVSKAVGYGYNTDGQLTTLTTPSGQTITYSYANNRIAGITINSTTLLSSVLYDPFGPVRQWTWGNASLAVREFDQDGNIDQIDSAGLKTYAQDDAFRITGITDTVSSALSWSYGYDLNDRLNSASKTGQSQSWTYDANGNRLTQGGSTSSTYTISSSSNRLSSVSGALSRTYTYDVTGNTTGYAGFTFGYNDAGRLTSVSGSATASYGHNALGQRVKKTAGGVTTYFVYDEVGHLIGEYDGSGALIQETVWMSGIPVATLRPNGGGMSIYYIHTDHLNTPRRISRPSDDLIVWRWDSDPFGSDSSNQDPDGDATQFTYQLRFPGQYFDAEMGLNYNYFRDYDPIVARYTQSDPIGLQGGANTYIYAFGAPVMHSDSTGLFVDEAGTFLQMCAKETVGIGTRVLGGAALVFTPNPNPRGACSDNTPPEGLDCTFDDECAKLYARIDAALKDLKRRYWQYAGDTLGLPETGPFSRETHRTQFEQRQQHLRVLLDEAIVKGCLAYDPQAWTWATRKLLELPRSSRGIGR